MRSLIKTYLLAAIAFVVVAAGAAFAQVPDPGTPGPLAVTREEYNFGDTAFQPTNFPGPVELRASIHYPTNLAGGPFPVRALPAVIWIDDQIVGNGIENETLSQITAITFDSSLVREGGVVSLSYGEDKETRVKIPQRLRLAREGGNQ